MGQPMMNFSLPDFLVREDVRAERHEFYRGEVFAIVGARRIHGGCTLQAHEALEGVETPPGWQPAMPG